MRVIECALIPGEKPVSTWSVLLDRCDHYSFFQTPHWSDILQTVLTNVQPYTHWFRFSDGREAVLPLFSLPKKWGVSKLESLPWGTYGDLIGEGNFTLEHRAAAVSQVLSLRRPLCEITLLPGRESLEIEPSFLQIETKEMETHILTLNDSFEETWKQQFHARNRNAIRRAKEKGIEVTWSNGKEGILAIKGLYEEAVKRWTGIETLPGDLFDALIDAPGEEIRIWLARLGSRVLTADAMFYGRGEAQYFAGASDPNFGKMGSSKLLMSEIIRDACERGYRKLNFGSSGGLEGVEQFKESFGGHRTSYRRLRFIHPWMKIGRILNR